jgi:hypothetical protein
VPLTAAVTLGVSSSRVQEDKKVKERIDSRNGLEGYCYNLKNMLEDADGGVKDKLSDDDKRTIETAVAETLEWMDDNQLAGADEYKAKQREIGACRRAMQRVCASQRVTCGAVACMLLCRGGCEPHHEARVPRRDAATGRRRGV